MRWIIHDFDIKDGGEASQPLRTNAEGIDFLIDLDPPLESGDRDARDRVRITERLADRLIDSRRFVHSPGRSPRYPRSVSKFDLELILVELRAQARVGP